jgi:hypothetical protein
MAKAIEVFAEEVRDDMLSRVDTKDDKYEFIDPITILMIISITVGVIRAIQECRKNNLRGYSSNEAADYLTTDIKFRALNHGFLTRWKLKKAIKKHLSSDQYSYYGNALMRSILEKGGYIDQEVICDAMEMSGE